MFCHFIVPNYTIFNDSNVEKIKRIKCRKILIAYTLDNVWFEALIAYILDNELFKGLIAYTLDNVICTKAKYMTLGPKFFCCSKMAVTRRRKKLLQI